MRLTFHKILSTTEMESEENLFLMLFTHIRAHTRTHTQTQKSYRHSIEKIYKCIARIFFYACLCTLNVRFFF